MLLRVVARSPRGRTRNRPPGAFATWASKQAGQTIRKEDLARTFERLFADSSQMKGARDAAVGAMAELSAELGRQPIGSAIWKALEPDSAFDRASGAIARGNRRCSRRSAANSRACWRCQWPRGDRSHGVQLFCDSLRRGDPPDGQRYLRQAFTAYGRRFARPTSKARRADAARELGNRLARADRLQPEIAEAIDAPFEEPVKLRRDLLRYLLRLRIRFGLRVLLDLIPGRSTSIKKVLDDVDAGVKQIAHDAITEGLMTLALPGEVLSLGRDVPGAFPAPLQTIEDGDLGALLSLIDPTPDTTRGSGAEDWSNLPERIHFIADLFRIYQTRPTLHRDPFTAQQVVVIKSGGHPTGQL